MANAESARLPCAPLARRYKDYSAAAGVAPHSSGRSSSSRSGKASAHSKVTTPSPAMTSVEAARLPVRSCSYATIGAAAAAPIKPTKNRIEYIRVRSAGEI